MIKLTKIYSKEGAWTVIDFIICEDEKVFATKYKKIIDNFMMRFDYSYKCHWFKGYGKEWEKLARDTNSFKIHILDIKTDKGSGLNAARRIREEIDDWTSIIIIVTSYNEYKFEILGKRLMILDFINKLDNYEENLKASLDIAIKNYDNRPKILKYTYKNSIYNIDFKNIVYIEKEADSKICAIHTFEEECIPYQGSIKKLLEKLDNRFMLISRGTLINLEQIKEYNTKTKEVVFYNGKKIDAISRNKKKGLIRYVRGLK